MQKMRFFVMMVLVMLTTVIMAQTTKVKGNVVDQSTGEGEPFATIRIYQEGQKEKPLAVFLTDENGLFEHEVEGKGKYSISINSIGKVEQVKEIQLGETAGLDLGTVGLAADSKTLKGVEVVAQKPLVKMEVDKMTYKVEDDPDSKSNTVLDMLRKVPMVNVDGQDNITVNGTSSFKVYVDGKPNVMFSSNPSMIFKSMPASAVKNIEVITNPGAKYDAEGAGGVLNIVMNRQNPMAMQSMDGFNGTLRASVGNKSVGGGAFVSGQKGKLSYSANVMENYSKPGKTEVEMEQLNGNSSVVTSAATETKLPFTLGSLSLGYDIDPMSSINATASLTSLTLRSNGTPGTSMGGSNYGNGFNYQYDTKTKNSRTSFSGNIDYQRFLNPERTRSIILTYQLSYAPSKTEQENNFRENSTEFIDLTDRYSLSKDKTVEHTFQTDYTTPLTTNQTLNLGAKFMTRKASSDSKYYLEDVYNESMSMDYEYRNTILAGYAEYETKWDNFGAKGGLRYEHTWQDVTYHLGNGESFKTDYGSLVPTANLSYNFSPTSNIGLTYNMRISRPGITYLNPYIDRSNPTALTYGNSDLDVEKSNNVALVYNTFSSKLMMNLSLRYNYTGNGIEQYSFYDNNILNTTYGNIVKRSQIGLNGYISWLMFKNTRLFFNGGASYNDMSSDALGRSNSGWQANLMMGVQQTLPWDLKLSAYMMTSTKSYTLQGWSSGFNLLTGNISKSFFNDKLTVSVGGLTGLSAKGSLKMETFSEGKGFSTRSTIKVPIQSVTLSVSYTFGNSKRQVRQHVSRVQSDYIEQQSQGEMINSVGDMNQQ